jgi:soluble lytic murein transglycosylase-like protein
MTDQVDKYVLEYMVQTKDSIKRIDELLSKQDKVDKNAKKSGESFKLLSGHLKGLASEAGEAGEAAVGLGEGLATLGAAAGPIAAVVAVIMLLKKALMETKATMDDLTSQRDLGAKIGLSGVSVENITRNLRGAKGSQIDQNGVNDLLTKIGTKLQSAYVDPSQMNGDAIALRMAGANINNKNGGINSTGNALDEMQTKFKSVSDEQARAIGRVIGLTNQQVDSMRNLEGAITDTTHMTAEETAARLAAQQRTEEVIAAQNKLSDHWRTLKEDLTISLIPALDAFVVVIDKIVQSLQTLKGWHDQYEDLKVRAVLSAMTAGSDVLHGKFGNAVSDAGKVWKESGQSIQQSAKQQMKTADDSAQETTSAQTELQRIINMFSQSVTQFSNTIDEKQAWAAWAGEIGRAGGLSSSGNKSLSMTGTGGNSASFNQGVYNSATMGVTAAAVGKSAADDHAYDAIFQAASAKYGIPAATLKRVAMAESTLNPSAIGRTKSGAIGGQGLMQINPANFAKYGVTNPNDPTQSIMAGAQILSENLKRYGNMDDALRAYNGGTDKSHWSNKETANYVGRVAAQNATINGEDFNANPDLSNNLLSSWSKMAYDPNAKPLFNFSGSKLVDPSKGGESREKSQLLNLQQQLAGQLGVPVSQLQTGGVSRGDVDWTASNMMANLVNSRYTLMNQMNVPGLTSMAKSGMNAQLRTTDMQIQNMMRYMPNIDSAAGAGGRNITIGTGAVQVIVQGANVSPEQLAKEINNTLGDHLGELVNTNADAVSH